MLIAAVRLTRAREPVAATSKKQNVMEKKRTRKEKAADTRRRSITRLSIFTGTPRAAKTPPITLDLVLGTPVSPLKGRQAANACQNTCSCVLLSLKESAKPNVIDELKKITRSFSGFFFKFIIRLRKTKKILILKNALRIVPDS